MKELKKLNAGKLVGKYKYKQNANRNESDCFTVHR